ncbi:PREDICTED: zinc finger protein 36, C3H1 type-like 1 [Gekko japonicus]|uniref:mRNA decay activator protein ZFP36 n=1 Tax=Gekko japonicus TaxID=146911 RepID=A0ABM1KKN2_GEKJA|nr:PREDICTED: zinc finger protein 36, C3H1 type-like 1 [Gekko japonicus]
MPLESLSPFVELDDALCKTFLRLNLQEDAHEDTTGTPLGFQRTFSACPVTLSSSHTGDTERLGYASVAPLAAADGSDPAWPLQGEWARDARLPRTSLQRIPFRADRSVSLIEGCRGEAKAVSARYKTELCRTFEESGACKYGAKCQFAHGARELRGLSRHPKYKTEPCRTFHTSGICPYGARCHFIHNAEERRPLPRGPQVLRHSLSAGEALPSPSPASPPPSASCALRLPDGAAAFPCDSLGCSLCKTSLGSPGPFPFPGLLLLQKSLSADSLSDQEDSGSSGASSGSASPGLGPLGRRLPIFSRLSVSDD